jgi:hypothetical protein
MKMPEGITARPRLKKLVRGVLVFLVLFSLSGFFILPPIVKSVALKQLSEKLKREVTIQSLKINPFLLSLTVRGFAVREPRTPETFVSFDELYLNFQTMSIFKVPVDDVKIEKDEYPKYLKMAYKAEKFPKPRNIIGIAKDLPVPEMEKLMLTHVEVKDDDLRMLASQRAQSVKNYILKSKQVEPERIFLVEPKSLQPEKKEKLRDSRIDFRLK